MLLPRGGAIAFFHRVVADRALCNTLTLVIVMVTRFHAVRPKAAEFSCRTQFWQNKMPEYFIVSRKKQPDHWVTICAGCEFDPLLLTVLDVLT